MTMLFFWRGVLQVVAVAARPRGSLNSKAQSNVWLPLLFSMWWLDFAFFFTYWDCWTKKGDVDPYVFGDQYYKQHTHLKKKTTDLLGVMVKGGCVGTKACFTVKRLWWNPPHMPSSLCFMGECILSIISHCNLQTNPEPGVQITLDSWWNSQGKILNWLFGSVAGRKGLGSFLI